jgi:DNA polymerase I
MNTESIIRKIENSQFVTLDTETLSLADKTLVSMSICCDGETFFIPVAMNTMKNIPEASVKRILKAVLNREGVIYHNYLFDSQVLRKYGFIPTKLPHDTMLIAYLLNENRRLKLKTLVFEIFNYEMATFKQVCGTGKKQISFADAPKSKAESYGKDDAEWTYRLFVKLYNELKENKDLLSAYENIERPLLLVVDDMHTTGVPIDKNKLEEIKKICIEKSEDYFNKIQYYMQGINLNSPIQLRDYFINKRYQPVLRRSRRTGEPSVDNEVLEKYTVKCPEAGWILKYRYYNKMLTTFIPALSPSNGDTRIRPSFKQVGTSSGRFSSSNPNGQNFPKSKDELGLRSCIAAPKGYKLIVYDYSGIEMRLAAAFSGQQSLIDAFAKSLDIHSEVAKEVGCKRDEAKVLSYALLYGAGVYLISKQLNSTKDEAQQYIYNYYKKYPKIREYITKTRKEAYEQGYLSIYGGRRRNISKNFETKSEWEKGAELRSMVNATIQGAAATLIKKAMLKIHNKVKDYNTNIIMQIHDELILLAPEDVAETVSEIVKKEMIDAGKDLGVKIEVDGGIGDTWQEVH